MAPMRPPWSGPTTCSSLSASTSASSESTRATPTRSNSELMSASEPASEAVCERTTRWATCERPVFTATIGLPSARATSTASWKPFGSGIASR